jgi:hypothetical protein
MVELRENRTFLLYSFREVGDGTMDREEKARHVNRSQRGD